MHRDSSVAIPFAQPQGPIAGLASSVAFASMVLNTGSSVAGRTGDHLEHVGGGGLLLQRLGEIVGALAQFVQKSNVLDRDAAWSAKVSTRAICLSVKGRTSR